MQPGVRAVNEALSILLQAAKDYPGASLDICSGYVATNGIMPLRKMQSSSVRYGSQPHFDSII